MATRKVEDLLREEYFRLAPQIRLVTEHLAIEIRHLLLDVSRELGHGERLEVQARSKDCESAIAKLRPEGGVFDHNLAGSYSLTTLSDLAAARVLVFPRTHIGRVNEVLGAAYPSWTPEPFKRQWKNLGFKYVGHCKASATIKCEYQIVPMLVGLFWQVQHAAIYKPSERIVRAVGEPSMVQREIEVVKALTDFEDEWSRLTTSEEAE